MSTAKSGNSKAIGTTKIRRLTSRNEGADYYLCTWKVKSPIKKGSRSPVFTVPNREECKWYLSVHALGDFLDEQIFFTTRLHLDSTSECEAAVAEFNLEADRHAVINQPCKSKTFKFIKNSAESSAAILSLMGAGELRYNGEIVELNVRCTITIENVIPEDDSFPNYFGSLLKDKKFSDVTLLVGRKKFQAHKLILGASSSVFAAMFTHNTTENQGVVDIKDLSKEVVEEMLRYIYTGSVEKMNELAQDLLIAADKYDLKGLRKKCEGALIESLSNSNVLDLLIFAESRNASCLKLDAINFTRRNKTELMETQGWAMLSKSNPALVREISEAHLHPDPGSDSDGWSEPDDESD